MARADISTVEPDVALVVGNNTLVSHQGRIGVPSDLPRDLHARGGSLIVIDPRLSELARRADIHLQSLPGADPIVLAGLLRVVLTEGLQDQAFVDAEVEGLDELRATVAAFTPERVAEFADIDADDLVEAARVFGRARKAYATAGTGPNMTGRGTLVEYLLLCLDTVLGHRPRAGELLSRDPCLSPLSAVPAVAQASGSFPAYEIGEPLEGSGLYRSAAGLPASAMAGEILAPGGIRALLSTGGNPASCLPGQQEVIRALESLELLVHTDVQMATTAQLAHYVLPALLPYEMHGMSLAPEFAGMYGNGLGYGVPYAQYTDPVVDPPAGSECMSQWEIFFRLGQRMGLEFELHPAFGRLVPGGTPTKIDMSRVPDLDEIYDIVFAGTRVPWREVRDARRGIFDVTVRTVAPKQPGWEARLNVGHPVMMADLTTMLTLEAPDPEFPLVLIPRRSKRIMNTPTVAAPETARHNPIWVHPKDLTSCGLQSGDLVEVTSAVGSVLGIAESDETLRPGVISMSHQFGELPSRDESEIRRVGTSVNWLLANSTANDRYSGQPQMSNVPVRIGPAPLARKLPCDGG